MTTTEQWAARRLRWAQWKADQAQTEGDVKVDPANWKHVMDRKARRQAVEQQRKIEAAERVEETPWLCQECDEPRGHGSHRRCAAIYNYDRGDD